MSYSVTGILWLACLAGYLAGTYEFFVEEGLMSDFCNCMYIVSSSGERFPVNNFTPEQVRFIDSLPFHPSSAEIRLIMLARDESPHEPRDENADGNRVSNEYGAVYDNVDGNVYDNVPDPVVGPALPVNPYEAHDTSHDLPHDASHDLPHDISNDGSITNPYDIEK